MDNKKSRLKYFLPINLVKFYYAVIKNYPSPYDSYTHEYKCIFIHISRTGGTSVAQTLFGQRNRLTSHSTYFDFEVFNKKLFDCYFKFAFVRNPWDRAVSIFNIINKEKSYYGYTFNIYKEFFIDCQTFNDFVLSLKNPQKANKVINHRYIGSQYQYIYDHNFQLKIDYLGHFETMKEDFEKIKNFLNIPGDLSHLRQTKPSNYTQYYNQETREIIADIYQKDIELFGYTFGE